jgi:hypothetical protein
MVEMIRKIEFGTFPNKMTAKLEIERPYDGEVPPEAVGVRTAG